MSVAIIGTGWGLRVQVPRFREAGLTVSALWARNAEKAQKLGKEHNIPLATSNYDEILNDPKIDLVVISTPPFCHLEMVEKAFQNKKHVLMEKPMAMDTVETAKMLDLSKKYDSMAIIDHELRFLEPMITMKKLISEGKVGKILHVHGVISSASRAHNKRWNWWSLSEKGGGVLKALGSHVIDCLQYLTGSRITAVNGELKTLIPERGDPEENGQLKKVTSDDYCIANLQFGNEKDGFVGNMMCSVVTTDPQHTFVVNGTLGTLSLSKNNLHFRHLVDSKVQVEKIFEEEVEVWEQGTLKIGLALKKKIVDNSAEPLSIAATFEDGHYTQRVMEAIIQSSESNKKVQV